MGILLERVITYWLSSSSLLLRYNLYIKEFSLIKRVLFEFRPSVPNSLSSTSDPKDQNIKIFPMAVIRQAHKFGGEAANGAKKP